MRVFKAYFKIMKKQLTSVTIYAVVFLALTVLLTRNYKVENNVFSTSKVKIMVVNEDGQNEFIEGFMNYLEQYAIFVEPKEDKEARKNDLFFRNIVYILTIPKGFTQEFTKGKTMTMEKEAVPDSADAISIDNAVNNYLNIAGTYIKHIPGISYTQLNNLINNTTSEQTLVTVETKSLDEVTYSNSFNMMYFNYLGYIMIACFISGVSIVMYSFRALDIRRKHTAAPLPGRSMNIQLILANMVYVLCYMIVFIIAGFVLNKSRMLNVNIWLTWLNAIIFSLTALSISYLIGITVKSKKAVQAISTALSLSLAFTSGIFVPQELISASVLKASSFAPAYWYVKANNAIAQITSANWSEASKIFGYMGIELGFAVAILSVALVVSKRKSQQE